MKTRTPSFTMRLLVLVALVMVVLVIIDYIALLEVPRRVARDTVEIALRENVQSLNATFRDDRQELVRAADALMERPAATVAVLRKNRAVLESLVQADPDLGPDVNFDFISPQEIDKSGLGVITAPYQLQAVGHTQPIVFYRPVNNAVLDRATKTAGGKVAFALERDDHYVARGKLFPESLRAQDVDTSIDPDVAEVGDVVVNGQDLHLYSRALTSDTSYQLHALSTPELETVALEDIRNNVRSAIAAMTLAVLLAFLLIVYFTNRSVRRFASRVGSLADGDFRSRMSVHGHDAFADLATSVNRLSSQLQDQIGQLADTAEAFRTTLETLEEGICVWSSDGEMTFWNRGAEQLTGISFDRAGVEDPVVSFLRAERAPGTRRVTLPVRRAGTGLVVDLVVTTMPDGGVVQTFRDTTTADMLQQTQRNFMATAAHQLRTPITTILGFSDTLSNPELELTDRQREEFLTIIREQSHQLQEISDAFFTNHQLANERVEVSIVVVQVQAVVEDALARVARNFPERADDIDEIVRDLPEDCNVLCDRRALIGVIGIVVENALKYGAPPISIGAQLKGGTVALVVADEGRGIDPYHQPRLFDPFYRIDVDMRSGIGGAGLGLFTARKLLEAMHGSIRVRSAPESGATFVIELPAAPVDEDTARDGTAHNHASVEVHAQAHTG